MGTKKLLRKHKKDLIEILVSKFISFIIVFAFIVGCSFNKNSKFWTNSQNLKDENKNGYEEILKLKETLKNEYNPNLKIKINVKPKNSYSIYNYQNNSGRINFDGNLKKSSRYKFSKIKNFYQYQPEISFFQDNIIFFESKGSILRFNNKSRLVWKKNYYNKREKKLNPVLQFANDGKFLVVADNIAKYYLIDIQTGDLIWSKKGLAPFNSQIKIFGDKFFIVDLLNTLRCFSLKDGKELWNINTEKSLVRAQKKISLVIVDKVIYFSNSIGDISAVDINKGELLWQLPTQSSLIYESAFSLKTSDLVSDKNNLFFSNNNNEFFSINIKTGNFNWKNNINSSLRSSIIGDYLISISQEGYLIVTEKVSGNIIRVTDIFNNFKEKKRDNIDPTGFLVGLDKVYVSTNIGRLLIVDIESGKTISTLKIDNEKISKPFILDKNLFLIKDNGIIRLN